MRTYDPPNGGQDTGVGGLAPVSTKQYNVYLGPPPMSKQSLENTAWGLRGDKKFGLTLTSVYPMIGE